MSCRAWCRKQVSRTRRRSFATRHDVSCSCTWVSLTWKLRSCARLRASRHSRLDVAAVLSAHFVECARDLAQRADLYRLHQFRKNVAAARGNRLQALERLRAFPGVTGLKVAH